MAKNWRRTREYRIWRAHVIRRDKRCVLCGALKHREAHHLNHASYFPEQRFDEKNGVCLCHDCHFAFHILYKQGTRKKCIERDFSKFTALKTYFEEKEKQHG